MPPKFKNKSLRAQWWDYSSKGTYFITINVKDRFPFFGTIVNEEMKLSEIGKIVVEEWKKGPELRPDMKLILFDFIVMPDHFHAIIEIGANRYNKSVNCLTNEQGDFISYNGRKPQSKNLASIIRGFKSAVTVRARKIDVGFCWQSLYHDRIIRDEIAFQNMTEYIRNNPKEWKKE